MFSEQLKRALTEEVVGQPRAIASVVRSVTRIVGGLTPLERSWCAHLFLGPPGTGRAHLVRTLARHLQEEGTAHTVSCNSGGHADPWMCFVQQLAPALSTQPGPPSGAGGPPKIILVQDLESAPKHVFPLLARLLETGQVSLPGGRDGRLQNCMVFLLSGLCTDKILETNGIGFAGSSLSEGLDDDQSQIVQACEEEAERAFGLELLAQLDDLVVFRRLEDEHLEEVLHGHFARVGRWFRQRGVSCELQPEASAFLLERGREQRLLGARDLISIHRREVEFPLADLMLSGQLDPGGAVLVDHEPGAQHLHFTVRPPDRTATETNPLREAVRIPVTG